MPQALTKYYYRKLFGLSHKELMEEPVQEFFTNLLIYNQIQEKQKAESKQRG